MGDAVAQCQGFLQRGAPQVQIAVFQAQRVVYGGVVADFKGSGLRLLKDLQPIGQHLDAPGGDLVVDRGALAHNAGNL